ncbi:hypothetical protein GCM10010969_07440 [Saccharibacillus kuerlensis]|uniref:Uncharacterized protein n=1 Tax=Saccharibacillus kuerlensis TaxID=459527 RepID=A0ABQ2KU91_9BACL|nr:hypothetical protein GCM10010969_07440 [Saccharibacillus kuerlensis]
MQAAVTTAVKAAVEALIRAAGAAAGVKRFVRSDEGAASLIRMGALFSEEMHLYNQVFSYK